MIIQYDDPKLRIVAEEVSFPLDMKTESQIRVMVSTMKANNGVGIAAPQLGISKRIFCIDFECIYPDGKIITCINPSIRCTGIKIAGEEACLSVDGMMGTIYRSKNVLLNAFDENGVNFKLYLSDIPARVVQHEYDHLDGILYFDKIDGGFSSLSKIS